MAYRPLPTGLPVLSVLSVLLSLKKSPLHARPALGPTPAAPAAPAESLPLSSLLWSGGSRKLFKPQSARVPLQTLQPRALDQGEGRGSFQWTPCMQATNEGVVKSSSAPDCRNATATARHRLSLDRPRCERIPLQAIPLHTSTTGPTFEKTISNPDTRPTLMRCSGHVLGVGRIVGL